MSKGKLASVKPVLRRKNTYPHAPIKKGDKISELPFPTIQLKFVPIIALKSIETANFWGKLFPQIVKFNKQAGKGWRVKNAVSAKRLNSSSIILATFSATKYSLIKV
jgi:hypothetical protein